MLMRPLDVLIIVCPWTRPDWLAKCRESAQLAASEAGYPVNIIESSPIVGHIGKAMLAAFERSTADYVAYIDCDDYVLPNAFACLARHFPSKPNAICAREYREFNGSGTLIPNKNRHHLTAWRRDIVERASLEAFPSLAFLRLHGAAKEWVNGNPPRIADEMQHVYVWRVYSSEGRKLMHQCALRDPSEVVELAQVIAEVDGMASPRTTPGTPSRKLSGARKKPSSVFRPGPLLTPSRR